ncbi:hypothetical protein Cni_G22563 [Canna indica]|uniref:DUF4057 domain-containing protein n=1 Tax=Canna indica TaxID=4628 RepID=A0AAQ3QJN9_9LILI|nr:hypothetical protein Cni_G22563 [Canna indica]
MYRNPPVRTSHSSTADLLSWSDKSLENEPVTPASSRRSIRPADMISPAMFGAPMTEEEAESVNKRKSCSGLKLQEMNGSGIFAADEENGTPKTDTATPYKTSVRICQPSVGSQISFGTEGIESPRKPTSIAEIAKQRELSGTPQSEMAGKVKKQISEAKYKELGGSDIFGPPPEVPPRNLAARNLELRSNVDFGAPQPRMRPTSVKVHYPAGGPSNITFNEEIETKTAKKIYTQKVQDLTGNDIFRGDALLLSGEKQPSMAKLKEMKGSNIFADGKTAARDYFGGVRKPPGGESTIAFA